jgi:uncharacterized protein YjdB
MKKFFKFVSFLLLVLTLYTPYSAVIPGNAAIAQAAAITLNTKAITLEIGHTYSLKLTGTREMPVWTTSKKTVAVVSSTGKVTAKAVGTAAITASINGRRYSCTVTVKKPVKISSTSLTLETGAVSTLKISGNIKAPVWSSNNKTVAVISSTGKITAKAPGTATITAFVDGKKLICKITVKNPIVISKNTLTLNAGKTYKLKITGTAKTITWSSSNKSVATVSGYGTITAHTAGTATITASVDGKKLTCKLTVTVPVNPYLKDAPFEAVQIDSDNFSFVIPKGWETMIDNSVKDLNMVEIYPEGQEDGSNIIITIYNTGIAAPDYNDMKAFFSQFVTEDFVNQLLASALGVNDFNISDFTQQDYPTAYGNAFLTSYSVNLPETNASMKQDIVDLYVDNYLIEVTASSDTGFNAPGQLTGIWNDNFNMQTVLDYLMKSIVIH